MCTPFSSAIVFQQGTAAVVKTVKRTIGKRNVRKLYKHSKSYTLTVPIEIVRELGWQERQKVVVKKHGQGILISDWE